MKLILQKDISLLKSDLNKLEDLGFSIEYYNNEKVEGDIYAGFPGQPFKELDNIKGLKFVQSLMVGFDHVDLEEIKARGIVFANASGVSSIPIAEYVILKILDYLKQSQTFRDNQKESFWDKHPENGSIKELYAQKVLVLGTGHIGSEIAKKLKAFGAFVIGVNSDGRAVEYFDETYRLSEVKKHLKKANFVVGALPLNADTNYLYNKEFFKAMDSEAVFINIGRGSQVVEADLLEVLKDHLAHVYLDVVPVEPLPCKSKLWSNPKISITPHVSASSNHLNNRIKDLVIKNAYAFKHDKEIINKVV